MKKLWSGLIALGLLAGGMMLLARDRGSGWTTASAEALAEFERGLDAQMKYYGRDARRHFEAALDLDPSFIAPKLYLLDMERPGEERQRWLEDLRAADLAELSPRERFLVRYQLARAERRFGDAERLIEEYLQEHPGDPFALSECSMDAWHKGDWKKAERHYRRLIQTDPNWVLAQNHLGYLAMAQGRFREAEELFKTYKFIAPDQANPHDSMGELLTLLGRYDEARAELEEALRIKPDFCGSYEHLIDLAVSQGRAEDIDRAATRAAEHCDEARAARIRCHAVFWKDFLASDFESAWGEERQACRELLGPVNFIVNQLAVAGGRLDEAKAGEQAIEEAIAKYEAEMPGSAQLDFLRGLLFHLRGQRLAREGRLESAEESLRKADQHLLFWGSGQGIFKLYNLLNLASVLERTRRPEEAAATVARVAKVNPDFAGLFTEMDSSPAP